MTFFMKYYTMTFKNIFRTYDFMWYISWYTILWHFDDILYYDFIKWYFYNILYYDTLMTVYYDIFEYTMTLLCDIFHDSFYDLWCF